MARKLPIRLTGRVRSALVQRHPKKGEELIVLSRKLEPSDSVEESIQGTMLDARFAFRGGRFEELAAALGTAGTQYLQYGCPRGAIPFFEDAVKLFHVTGNKLGETVQLYHLGMAHSEVNNPRRAAKYYTRALATSVDAGEVKTCALVGLGDAHLQRRDFAGATGYLLPAAVTARDRGMDRLLDRCRTSLEKCATELGRSKFASVCARAGISRDEVGL